MKHKSLIARPRRYAANDIEQTAIKRAAQMAGVSLSEYIRTLHDKYGARLIDQLIKQRNAK